MGSLHNYLDAYIRQLKSNTSTQIKYLGIILASLVSLFLVLSISTGVSNLQTNIDGFRRIDDMRLRVILTQVYLSDIDNSVDLLDRITPASGGKLDPKILLSIDKKISLIKENKKFLHEVSRREKTKQLLNILDESVDSDIYMLGLRLKAIESRSVADSMLPIKLKSAETAVNLNVQTLLVHWDDLLSVRFNMITSIKSNWNYFVL